MNEYLKTKLSNLTKEPGCYLMKDKDNNIIYVGKAKNLHNRVNQYFVGSHDFKTTKLVSNIHDFDFRGTGLSLDKYIQKFQFYDCIYLI